MKTLVMAEKPSVGRDLAGVLGCGKETRGYCEGSRYVVTWAMGHLVELADPGYYDDRYKAWKLDHLPILPERMMLRTIRRTSRQFQTIKHLFHRNDIDRLVVATDAGREGELVARWIMKLGGWKGPFSRLWISSQTRSAISEGFENLKPGASYDNLFRAAECRAEADWIIGLNVTRALTCRHDARLSAGRVQTPTLAMVVERESKIEEFTPIPYWTIHGDFGDFTAAWKDAGGGGGINDQSRAEKILNKVQEGVGIVTGISRKDKADPPPLAYDLTSLQRDANAVHGLSAKRTLQIIQGLYEHHKILTYPRTDSKCITTDMVPTLKDRLKACIAGPYGKSINMLLKKGWNPGSRFVNNSKVTDHHAIIPTEEKAHPDNLSGEEKLIWNLVVQRFVALLLPPYRYTVTQITIEVNGETFGATARQVKEKGWRDIAGSLEEELSDEELISFDPARLTKGATKKLQKAESKKRFTTPPPRYTEGTLLGAMENAGRFINDKDLRESIAGTGIGTPATRADIIEKLLDNYTIERRGKELIPTSRGKDLLDLVPPELQSPELTARWEQRLARIARGTEKPEAYSRDIRENSKKLVMSIVESAQRYKPSEVTGVSCPLCGKKMISHRDKKGRKLLVCPSFACGHEQGEESDDSRPHRSSKREKALNRKLIRQFSDHSKDTVTLGDMIKAAEDKKQREDS